MSAKRPPGAEWNQRFSDEMATAQARVQYMKYDLENADNAAEREWGEVKGKALACNVLCWVLPLIGWCCYCQEAKTSRTSQYINDLTTVGTFKALVEAIRKARPVQRLGIVCGHTETTHSTDSNANTTTSSRFVETHRASENFDNFAIVLDETIPADDMWALLGEMRGGQVAEGDALLVCQW
jgi:hypothetical protein